MNRRVLVTGASGFVGRPLVQALIDDGWSVVGASRSRPAKDPGVADWVEIDLLTEDPRRMIDRAGAETLIHLAWIATPGVYGHSMENIDWLRASTSISAAFLGEGGQSLIGVGSCFEYLLGGKPARTGPTTLYGAAKHACRIAFEQQVASAPGRTLAWARIFYLLGADDHPDRFAPSLARNLVAGLPAKMSRGAIERDFIDVRDCARAIAALAGSKASGNFDIATGQGRRLRDLAETMARMAGRSELLRFNPALDRADEPDRLIGDPAPISHATSFSPIYSIEESISDLLQHWKDQRTACAP